MSEDERLVPVGTSIPALTNREIEIYVAEYVATHGVKTKTKSDVLRELVHLAWPLYKQEHGIVVSNSEKKSETI